MFSNTPTLFNGVLFTQRNWPQNFSILMFEVPNSFVALGWTWTFANWIRHWHQGEEGGGWPSLSVLPHTLVILSFLSLFSGLNLSEEKLDFSSNKWWVRARGVLWLSLADMVWLMSSAQHSFWANMYNDRLLNTSIQFMIHIHPLWHTFSKVSWHM